MNSGKVYLLPVFCLVLLCGFAWGDTLSGTAYMADGSTPVSNLLIYFYTDSGAYAGYVYTDAGGAYSITLDPGSYRFDLSYNGSQSGLASSFSLGSYMTGITLSGNTTQSVTLPAFYRVYGLASGGTTPIESVFVSASTSAGNNSSSGTIYTGSDGLYELYLLPGTCSMDASAPWGSQYMAPEDRKSVV